MDSLTQFALGAGIGMATLGRCMGMRKAAVTGGLLGTLPDLDVFYPFDDPVDSFVLHRAATHSLFVQAAAAPVIAELLRLLPSLRQSRGWVYLAVFLSLWTHALLDAMTVYGTRIFWPFWPEPVGLGSIFIIDPLYTLPLLLVVLWGLFAGGYGPRLRAATSAALLISTAYLGWTVLAQQWAQQRAESYLAGVGSQPERLLATPTPFNTLFWRAIAVEGERYHNLYIPLLGGAEAVTAYSHQRLPEEGGCLEGIEAAETLAAFSKGFYKVAERGGAIVLSDLRMGVTPNYVFNFAVARALPGGTEPIPPQQIAPDGRDGEGDVAWLLAGIAGRGEPRPLEAAAAFAPAGGGLRLAEAEIRASC
jgi:inner membrane protein